MRLRFHKMHGLGNDFAVVDARSAPFEPTPAQAQGLADRRTGIGFDQLIVVGEGDDSDVTMRIWNADGSEVAACGNATRCVPVLLGRDVSIRTAAGLLVAELTDGGASVDMGAPSFAWDTIPLAYPADTAALPLAWGVLERPVAVNVGNPHLAFFVDDVAAIPLGDLGPEIEHDPLFPERINVNIATVSDRDHIMMRTWERGAGLTRACGTGACATFAAARRLRRVDARVTIDLPGGRLTLAEGDTGHLLMSGPAVHVFAGEIDLDRFG